MRVITGIQPSGTPHIGNYFGGIKPTVDLSRQGETFLFIADYHSLTTQPAPEELRERVAGLTLDLLACGFDADKNAFFRQSEVPAVTELMWILNCITTVGFLERAHSYKDKVAKGFAPNNGLFSYPVLMAADILIYDTNLVPVGKDQKQHLEITRDLAIRFNQQYGEIFVVPEAQIREDAAVIPGLDGQKMSKSYNNIIPIFGKEKAIRKTVMSIVTDSKGMDDVKDPESCNVFALYKLFATPEQQQEMRENYARGNYGYGHAKQALFELMWEKFRAERERREELANNMDYVWSVLAHGAERAREVAENTMQRVRKAVGLR